MLPWLIGGLLVGAGKLIYDAVTDDSSSSSSSRGPSEEDIKKARADEAKRQRKAMTKELLESTAKDVATLLQMHGDLVEGEVKSKLNLSEENLRRAAKSASTASGLEMLTPLTTRLSYRDSHAEEQLKIKRIAAKRDALRELVKSL